MTITEYSDETIAEIFIIGGMVFCSLSVKVSFLLLVWKWSVYVQILTLCTIISWCRRLGDDGDHSQTRRRSNNSIVRAQSHSVVRGEHPMAFMLPSVSLSEAGSETDSMSCYSDLDPAMSPYTSLSSMTGSNIYSQSLSLLSPHASPRSLPATVRSHLKSPTALPRFSSLPKPVQKYQDQDGEDQGSNSRSLGKVGVRLTHRSDKNELLVMKLALILFQYQHWCYFHCR